MQENQSRLKELMSFLQRNKPTAIVMVVLLFLIFAVLGGNISQQRQQAQSINATVTAIAQWNSTMTETAKQFAVATMTAKTAYTETPVAISTPTEISKPTTVPEIGLNITRKDIATVLDITLKKQSPLNSEENYIGSGAKFTAQVIGPGNNVKKIIFKITLQSPDSGLGADMSYYMPMLSLLNLFNDWDASDWVREKVLGINDRTEEKTFNGISFGITIKLEKKYLRTSTLTIYQK